MTRRTFTDVRREEIVAERGGVLTLARAHCGQIDALVERRRISAEDATHLKERLRAFADQIATGLHREGTDPAGTRAAMRAIVLGDRR